MSSKYTYLGNNCDDEETVDLSEWMTNLPKEIWDLPLNELTIPGTHDSGSYWLNPELPIAPDECCIVKCLGQCAKSVVCKWSLTQELTVADQLEQGVRYLDMRTAYLESEDDFFVCHGLHGKRMSDLFAQVNDFLIAHSKEVVLIDFNHNYNFTPLLYGRFAKLIVDVFGEKMYPLSEAGPKSTLNDIWKAKKQVIIFYDSDKSLSLLESQNFWPGASVYSPWFNTSSVTTLIECLDCRFDDCHENAFNVFQAILSPQLSTVVCHLTSSLKRYLVHKCNKAVSEWLKKIYALEKHGVNIVICDFVTKNHCLSNIVRLNNVLINDGNMVYYS